MNKGRQMKSIVLACISLLFAPNVGGEFLPQTGVNKSKVAAFAFGTASYLHRFTQGNQHEYTPAGQEDLNAWTDMVTLLVYPAVKDGEGLAATASAVLDNYKANKAVVVRTDSVPRTKDKPAEHLMVVIFGRPEFIEIAFSRFRLHNGVGSAIVYSHRIYGKTVGDAMNAWMQQNAPATEKTLMTWDAMPALPSSR